MNAVRGADGERRMNAATVWARRVLVAGGVAAMGWWAWLALTAVPPHWWLPWGAWLAGSVALHDAVIAPVVVALGWLVLVRLPALARTQRQAVTEERADTAGSVPVRAAVLLRGAVMVLGTLLLVWLVALWSAA